MIDQMHDHQVESLAHAESVFMNLPLSNTQAKNTQIDLWPRSN